MNTTIATPLRAEPIEIDNAPRLIDSWAIRDANGKLVCHCYSKETAALIVGIVNGQKKALRICEEAETIAHGDYQSGWNAALAHVKAALAAGGGKV